MVGVHTNHEVSVGVDTNRLKKNKVLHKFGTKLECNILINKCNN